METFKRTPLQLFNLPQNFMIPLFQRPYVWKETEQWEPLWSDIRRVAELRIAEPELNATHFLGAVVIQSHEAQSKRLTTWNVIDGQQRLTTLQILADATCALLAGTGQTRLAGQLEHLTHNDEIYIEEGDSRLKVRHLNKDQDAFDEVMSAEPPVDHADLIHADSQIVAAHAYFSTVVEQWLGSAESDDYVIRAKELTSVLLDGLQLVSIELEASENSQEIFETLNARGTPLTAADLVRNFVFQRLDAEGADTSKAYREDWPFETKFWTKDVSVGRNLVSRSSLFLNQWLVARTGDEVSPHATFNRFKSYVELESGQEMAELLPVIKRQAQQYEAWTEAASRPGGSLDSTEMAVYRMRAGGVEVLKPLLLWLHEPGKNIPQTAIDTIIQMAESWVVRRQLLRLTGSSLGRIVADVIAANSSATAGDLAERVTSHLARLNVTTTYWPGDEELRRSLTTESAYTRFPRGRLRMALEAAEDHYRAETGQPQIERKGYPIEHLLPRSWTETWRVDTPAEAEERQAHVHRLGNLTLLTTSLNSKVSNGPWSAKRSALQDHNTLTLTGRVIKRTENHDWDEELIDERTEDMIDALLHIWPVPEGHHGKVIDPQTKAGDGVELKHLIEAGLLFAGDKLVATHRDFKGREATLAADGSIEVDGKRFTSPSAASRALRERATNGWYFWAVADGRRLRDVR
ncbi:MAG: GmrSD restriction endonuclease domain-containing protein, partial [Microbacterium sp.]|uniref:GmrSD restriction endonuclease domain-containing protein n=1 Tax=Microbacterium sp. TaxID=51671 RepID=UPI003F98DCE2